MNRQMNARQHSQNQTMESSDAMVNQFSILNTDDVITQTGEGIYSDKKPVGNRFASLRSDSNRSNYESSGDSKGFTQVRYSNNNGKQSDGSSGRFSSLKGDRGERSNRGERIKEYQNTNSNQEMASASNAVDNQQTSSRFGGLNSARIKEQYQQRNITDATVVPLAGRNSYFGKKALKEKEAREEKQELMSHMKFRNNTSIDSDFKVYEREKSVADLDNEEAFPSLNIGISETKSQVNIPLKWGTKTVQVIVKDVIQTKSD